MARDRKEHARGANEVQDHCGGLPRGVEEGAEAADVFEDEKYEEGRALYGGNGKLDFGEALTALGIPWEYV